ncbi:MAG: hypothetical protein GY862_22210 [Gammaproteobacteria bacterium]|nr:hypothetical protein [Gammaproteobacteria bacterium]
MIRRSFNFATEKIQKFYNSVFSSGENKSPLQEHGTAHVIAPYLPDRWEQEKRLKAALRAYLPQAAKKPKKPFLCLVHGDDCEHTGFARRIEKHFLEKKMPGFGERHARKLPLDSSFSDTAELHELIKEALNREKILESLRQERRRAALLEFSMYAHEWFEQKEQANDFFDSSDSSLGTRASRPHIAVKTSALPANMAEEKERSQAENAVSAFIRFWGEKAELPELSCPCLIFLYFRYTPEASPAKRRAAEKWCEALEELDTQQFEKRFGVSGIALPRLHGISLEHMRKWTDLPEVYRGRNVEELRRQVEQIFTGCPGQPPNPGQKRKLVNLLLKCPCTRDPGSRRALLDELPSYIADKTKESDNSKGHVANIVNACMLHPGGLGFLHGAVNFFDGESIPFQTLTVFMEGLGWSSGEKDRNNAEPHSEPAGLLFSMRELSRMLTALLTAETQ